MHHYRASASPSPVDADGDSPTSKSGPVRFADVLSTVTFRPHERARALAIAAGVPGGQGLTTADAYDGVAAATYWASLGYKVMPLKSIDEAREKDGHLHNAGKLPALRGPQEEQGTRDPEQIQRWWGQNPGRGVGIPTQANRLLVIDVDNGIKQYGEMNFVELCHDLGIDLSEVPASKSPNYHGGYHFFWRLPASFPKMSLPFVSKLADDVDVPWFVVAPGSWKYTTVGYDRKGAAEHSVGIQTWVSGDPRQIPMAPKALKDKLARRGAIKGVPATEEVVVSGFRYRTDSTGEIDVNYYTEHGIPLGLPNGQNGLLYRIACKMAGQTMGLTEDEAVKWCWKIIAKSPNKPNREPWTVDKVEDVVAGAYVWVNKDNAEKAALADSNANAELLNNWIQKGLVR